MIGKRSMCMLNDASTVNQRQLRYVGLNVKETSHLCIFSERELTITFAKCHRPSVCLSVCRLSVTFVRPTQANEIFGNVSTPFGTLAIC